MDRRGSIVALGSTSSSWSVGTLRRSTTPRSHNELVHATEHLSFVATSAVFWWVLVGAGRRAGWGAGVVAAFLSSLSGIALGAAMTFATRPWYPVYGTGAHALRTSSWPA